MKLQYVRDYLTSPAGQAWDRVVVADAVDVIPSSATAESIERAFQQLGAGDDALVVSAEPACWIGAACTDAVVAALRRALPRHFASGHAFFPNSGQLAGSRAAVLRWLEFALRVAGHASSSAPPPALAALWPQNGAAGLDDQGLLLAYWMHRPQAVRVDSGGVLFGQLSRWYLLRSEIGLDGRTPLGRAAVPSCVGLHSAHKRFADGEGHHCDDAFNADGFSRRNDCAGGGRRGLGCGLQYSDGHETLRPLLGWHGAGHSGRVLFRALWDRIRADRWPTAAAAPTSAGPSGRVRDYKPGRGRLRWGFGARGSPPTMASAPCGSARRLRAGARRRYVSFSSEWNDCSWSHECAAPLITADAAASFRSISSRRPTRRARRRVRRTATAWRAGRASAACARAWRPCGVQLSRGLPPAHSTICTPQRLRMHARNGEELARWLADARMRRPAGSPARSRIRTRPAPPRRRACAAARPARAACGGRRPLADARCTCGAW